MCFNSQTGNSLDVKSANQSETRRKIKLFLELLTKMITNHTPFLNQNAGILKDIKDAFIKCLQSDFKRVGLGRLIFTQGLSAIKPYILSLNSTIHRKRTNGLYSHFRLRERFSFPPLWAKQKGSRGYQSHFVNHTACMFHSCILFLLSRLATMLSKRQPPRDTSKWSSISWREELLLITKTKW